MRHDNEFCRQIEIEILNFVVKQPNPVSMERIGSEINLHRDPPASFHEIFHHTYNLVDRRALIVETEGNSPKIVFTVPK